MMRRAVGICGPIVLTAIVWAQQPAAPQQPVFRANTELVQLDISVLDKDRHPVRDLKASDFTVLEDGKPQPVVAFTAVDVPDPPPSSSEPAEKTWTRNVAPDVATNALPPEGRLFVMVLDDVLIPGDQKIVQNAKKVAHSVVDHLSATDQMAIVLTGDGRKSQSFTTDHVRLNAVVDTLTTGNASYLMGWDTAVTPSMPGCAQAALVAVAVSGCSPPAFDGDMGLRQGALNTLRSVADALAAAPQRRKVLVYVSPGVPIDYDAKSPQLVHGTGQGQLVLEAQRRLSEQLDGIFRDMQRANITVYPIDPDGVDGLQPFIVNRLRGLSQFQGTTVPMTSTTQKNGLPNPSLVPLPTDVAHKAALEDLDFLETTAASTGGRAIVNTDDFEPGIAEMFRENGSYYLLGYQATDPGSGKMHRFTVKVDRPDVEVRTRSGYYASDAEEKAKTAAASPVATAIAGVLPASELSMQLVVAPFAASGPTGATVAIAVGIAQPSPTERTPGTIDVETRAFTPDGNDRGTTSQQKANLAFAAGGPDDVAHVQLLSHMDLKPGRYQLRLAAHSSVGDRTGSVFADVDIPDFANAPVSLSGVLFESRPAPPSAPKDALAAIVPIVPTVSRIFDRRDLVNAFVRAYQGGAAPLAPLTLTIRIIDAQGQTMMNHEDSLGAASFDAKTRADDDRVALPMASLAPGEYLLTIETAVDKTTAKRDVRFTVK